MGYITKFNIGDLVWIIDSEIVREKCDCCNSNKSSYTNYFVRKVKVTDIRIYNGGLESYNFPSLPRACTSNNVYSTKEEAEKYLKY